MQADDAGGSRVRMYVKYLHCLSARHLRQPPLPSPPLPGMPVCHGTQHRWSSSGGPPCRLGGIWVLGAHGTGQERASRLPAKGANTCHVRPPKCTLHLFPHPALQPRCAAHPRTWQLRAHRSADGCSGPPPLGRAVCVCFYGSAPPPILQLLFLALALRLGGSRRQPAGWWSTRAASRCSRSSRSASTRCSWGHIRSTGAAAGRMRRWRSLTCRCDVCMDGGGRGKEAAVLDGRAASPSRHDQHQGPGGGVFAACACARWCTAGGAACMANTLSPSAPARR